ncbi:hypothetical protein REPUB_Repub12eG0076900 [Reevesia pubescens]
MEVSTVFVNNIPKKVHWRWLRKIFQNQGKVVDVFIPKKRSGNGKKFGFVRFGERNDALHAIEFLHGAWLMNLQLGVNMARFNKMSEYWRKVKGGPEVGNEQASNIEKQKVEIFNKFRIPRVSFKDVLIDAMKKEVAEQGNVQGKKCEGVINASCIYWLQNSIVVVTKSKEDVESIAEKLNMANISFINVKVIGK